jgi:hypothetical protein
MCINYNLVLIMMDNLALQQHLSFQSLLQVSMLFVSLNLTQKILFFFVDRNFGYLLTSLYKMYFLKKVYIKCYQPQYATCIGCIYYERCNKLFIIHSLKNISQCMILLINFHIDLCAYFKL